MEKSWNNCDAKKEEVNNCEAKTAKKEEENNCEAKTAKKEKEIDNCEAKTDAKEEEIVRRETRSTNVKEDTIEVRDEKMMSRVQRMREEEKDLKGDDGKKRGERSQQWFYQAILN